MLSQQIPFKCTDYQKYLKTNVCKVTNLNYLTTSFTNATYFPSSCVSFRTVGSGIFVSPSGLLIRTGSVGISFIIWLSCGLLSLLGELSNRFSHDLKEFTRKNCAIFSKHFSFFLNLRFKYLFIYLFILKVCNMICSLLVEKII